MTFDMIEKFLDHHSRKGSLVNIHFKERNTISGMFVMEGDYEDLKSKNFWRIVNFAHVDEWKKTKNVNLTRVFNGISFTRLSEYQSPRGAGAGKEERTKTEG